MFWWFIFFCDLFTPALMIVAGRWMWKHPPKEINAFLGYRTPRSMLNMDTWNFAHHHCGKRWWIIGWILLLPTVAIHIPFYGKGEDTIGWMCIGVLAVQLTVLIASIFPTERALKKTFREDGTRR